MTTSGRSRQTSFAAGSPWIPTPNEADARKGGLYHKGGNLTLRGFVEVGPGSGLLPTPTTMEHRDGTVLRKDNNLADGGKHGVGLNHLVEGGGYSPPATPASRSATPGSGPARMTPGTSGLRFVDSLPDFRRTDRIGSFSRTFAATSAWGSTVCSLTWTTSATPARRGLFLLRASARSTAGTGSGSSDALTKDGLLTTPTTDTSERSKPYAQGGKSLAHQASTLWRTPSSQEPGLDPSRLVDRDGNPPTHWNQRLYDRETGRLAQHSLTQDVAIAERMRPTPRAGKTTDEDEEAWRARQERGDVSTPPLSLAVKMWPTPTVQDGKNAAGPSQWERNSDPLNGDVQRVGLLPTPTVPNGGRSAQKPAEIRGNTGYRENGVKIQVDLAHVVEKQPGQKLNPDFVERLMGFPPGWTILSPSSDAASSTESPSP